MTQNVIKNLAELANFHLRVAPKTEKEGVRAEFLAVTFFDRNDKPIPDMTIVFRRVRAAGIQMPHKRMGGAKGAIDFGPQAPMTELFFKKGSEQQQLFKAYCQMVFNGLIVFAYGLEKKGTYVIDIERVLVPNQPANTKPENVLYAPRVHYADGTFLDVKKTDLNEVLGNSFKFLATEMRSDDVFFVNKIPLPFYNEDKNGNVWPKFNLCPKASKEMKRAKEADPRPEQLTIRFWGLELKEEAEIDGAWKPGKQNIIERMPLITSSEQKGAFAFEANVYMQIAYIFAGDKFGACFSGLLFRVHGSGANAVVDNREAEDFESDLPDIVHKPAEETAGSPAGAAKMSKAKASAAAAKSSNDPIDTNEAATYA